jgi:hypothetical protein
LWVVGPSEPRDDRSGSVETIQIEAMEEINGNVIYEFQYNGIGYRYEWDGSDTGTYTLFVYGEDGSEKSVDMGFRDHNRACADLRMRRTVEAGAFLINAKLAR